jgi:hypothetical protein
MASQLIDDPSKVFSSIETINSFFGTRFTNWQEFYSVVTPNVLKDLHLVSLKSWLEPDNMPSYDDAFEINLKDRTLHGPSPPKWVIKCMDINAIDGSKLDTMHYELIDSLFQSFLPRICIDFNKVCQSSHDYTIKRFNCRMFQKYFRRNTFFDYGCLTINRSIFNFMGCDFTDDMTVSQQLPLVITLDGHSDIEYRGYLSFYAGKQCGTSVMVGIDREKHIVTITIANYHDGIKEGLTRVFTFSATQQPILLNEVLNTMDSIGISLKPGNYSCHKFHLNLSFEWWLEDDMITKQHYYQRVIHEITQVNDLLPELANIIAHYYHSIITD